MKEINEHSHSAAGPVNGLISSGYGMSEEEKTLLDGTHELFQLEREKSV